MHASGEALKRDKLSYSISLRTTRRGRRQVSFPNLGTLEVSDTPDVAHDVRDFSFGG